ncbi:MAG: VCBS repeat-containing protein [Saprospiraceae bacterium]|uniref:VCBS repeat-containing protein n=1 Tax=Candidatus Opimibacter skivensis TaxID=2982028 RepID=A0A9D7XS07_9BACT|nr:VCBS repeat-containing protein [Candidatus Opimibacter skivensis]
MKSLPFFIRITPMLILCITFGCKKNETETSTVSSDYKGFVSLPSSKTHVTNSNDLPETETTNHLLWESYYHGGGVAVGDVNNDGLADLFFTNTMKPNALYLNKGEFVFEDVTTKAGLGGGAGVNWGTTMADIDGDGWLDIYVCKSSDKEGLDVNRNKCYINQHDGTFKEMAKEMGIDNPGCSLQAAFFDYDLDNDLDLFLMNQPSNARSVRDKYTSGDTKQYTNSSTSDRLYRNDGNLKFTDVSEAAGVVSFSYGLGLKICDLNGDQWPDVYVACDYDQPDQCLINNGNGTFTNTIRDYFSHISNFSMGIDIGDINNDAMDDVFVVDMAGINHLRSKTNMPSMSAKKFWSLVDKGFHYQYMHNVLQLNRGNNVFSDISYQAGVSKTDWSWGVLMMDADNDGFQDIYVTNGIKRDIRNSDYTAKFMQMIDNHSVPADLMSIVKMVPSSPMPHFMFHNDGHLHFKDEAPNWGLGQLGFSNGCSFADLDKDGDLDIVVNNVDVPAFIYENKANEDGNHYIQFELKSSLSKRPVEGTRISLYAGGKIIQSQYFHPVHGYMSSSEPLVHFGLGKTTSLDSAVIIWPDRNISIMDKPNIDTRHVVNQDKVKKVRKFKPENEIGTWVMDKSSLIVPEFKHKENVYDDYADQLLLPFKISTLGPGISVADVNGDKLEDFFIGGAAGQSGALYLQNTNGGFDIATAQPWSKETVSDDLGVLFFDADGDGDQDLYIATGGAEFIGGDLKYNDQMYINNGKGIFSASSGLPHMNISTKAIAAGDFDKDGDLDLFIGSRNSPKKYPYSDVSYFLKNTGGKFTDATKEILSDDPHLGMITDAKFIDKDNDGDFDLLICGEWIAPTWLINDGGKFKKSESPELKLHTGWWNTIEVADINGDGIMDILAGNAGTNNKFKASPKEPFIVLGSDFDQNGSSDIVLATQFDGKEVPVRGRECSSQQLPYIAKEYPSYEGFAKASLQDIIGKDKIKGSMRLELTEFKSGIFWGTKEGDYRWEAFPVEAQLSPIVGFAIADADGDGKSDVIAAGNLYDMEVETTRYDAGQGVIMSWTADGGWISHTPKETGFYAGGNIRGLKPITVGGKKAVLLARGNDKLSMFEIGK